MSALPPRADIFRGGANVRFVPKADIGKAAICMGNHTHIHPPLICIIWRYARKTEGRNPAFHYWCVYAFSGEGDIELG